jgi:hypothetical protein
VIRRAAMEAERAANKYNRSVYAEFLGDEFER